jgi:hypothetical protein
VRSVGCFGFGQATDVHMFRFTQLLTRHSLTDKQLASSTRAQQQLDALAEAALVPSWRFVRSFSKGGFNGVQRNPRSIPQRT